MTMKELNWTVVDEVLEYHDVDSSNELKDNSNSHSNVSE